MASQNNENSNLTVSTVYETIKSPEILNELFWDVMSDLREKPMFKNLRETVEKVVDKQTDVIGKLPDKSEMAQKEMIAQLCCMAYAVDTVFSKILYMKMDKIFKGDINKYIEELKNERKLPEEILSKIKISSNMGESSSEENEVNHTAQAKGTEIKSSPERRKRNDLLCGASSSRSENQVDITKNKITYGRRKRLSRQEIEDNIKASKAITATAPAITTPLASTSQEKLIDNTFFSKNTEVKMQPEKEDSDAESEISVGHLSIATVSSVHTSDLSSFDDEISMSSDDEEGSKKRLSLKVLQQKLRANGPKLKKINGIKPKDLKKEPKDYTAQESNENKEIQKTPTKSTKGKTETQVTSPKVMPTTPECASSESSTSMTSRRIRKPNSKYSSDDIVIHSVKVKERKKQRNTSLNKSANGKNVNTVNSPKKRRSRSESSGSSDAETPKKMQKIDISEAEKNLSNEKSASKQNEMSGLCKPQWSHVRPLTSRKTAPVTLYSTS